MIDEGQLEVLYKGIWGTVCGDQFSDTEAKVFCYQLGYGLVTVTLFQVSCNRPMYSVYSVMFKLRVRVTISFNLTVTVNVGAPLICRV